MRPDRSNHSDKPLSAGRLRVSLVAPRLLPVAILCLGATIVVKSAGLICAAIAQPVAASLAAPGAAKGSPATTPGTGATKRYWPVSNWTDRPPPPPMCKPNPFTEAGESSILLELKHRKSALDARAVALDREQQELAAVKLSLRSQIATLKPLAARFKSVAAARKTADNVRWAKLVATYGAMDPASAARIFDGLRPKIVFNVISRMSGRKSAAILALMRPKAAQSITMKMAGMQVASANPQSFGDGPMGVQPTTALLPDNAP